MNDKPITEEIKFLTETVKMFWAVTIALSGGIAALIANPNSINKPLLLIGGLFFLIITIFVVKDLNKQIYKLIKKIGD